MFMAAVISNIPEIMLGICWTSVSVYAGYRFGKWRASRK